jgi:hypothetical protein
MRHLMVEGVEKSKERPIRGNYPGCMPERQLLIAREARRVQQRRLRPQADCNVQYDEFTT